jgi:hypothetical protein
MWDIYTSDLLFASGWYNNVRNPNIQFLAGVYGVNEPWGVLDRETKVRISTSFSNRNIS